MKMEEEHTLKLHKIGQLSSQGAEYHQSDDLDKAVRCYKEAYHLAREVNDDKTERTCAFNLGAAHIANGDYKEGLNNLHKAIPPEDQIDGHSNGDLYFNMGLGNEKLGNEDRALEDFRRANDEYAKFERDKRDLQIQCLEKCFQIYQSRNDYENVADICQLMADAFNGTDELSKAERLCEGATQLRFTKDKEKAMKAAEKCKNALNNCKPKGEDCIITGKIFNDLGLVFTQLIEYDEATACFEKAAELVRSSHKENHQLEAVVLQNLGAAYNFIGDYQRAIKFHEDAADKYAQIRYRNGQGQCFTNLAFALSQFRDWKHAEIAFHHALQASKDTKDTQMKWQALEGLGAVSFNQGNVDEAVNFFIEALKTVGENKPASDRIKDKMLLAVNARGPKHTISPYRGQDQMMYSGKITDRRTYMPTHGPAEDHNQLCATPRSQYVNEPQVIPRQSVLVTVGRNAYSQLENESSIIPREVSVVGEHPAMSRVQDVTPKRRIIQMRKKDSIGPHMPKIAQGFGSLTYDSPRVMSVQQESVLQEDSSEDDSSSASGSSSETSSGEDQADQFYQPQVSSEKIDQIFARPQTAETDRGVFQQRVSKKVRMSPVVPEEEHLSKYEEQLRAREANEELESESSSDESSDDSDESDDEESETGQDRKTSVKKPLSPPPLPTQSPSNTTQVSTKHVGTYLTPDLHQTPDAHLTSNVSNMPTVADVHETSDSSRRGAEQPPKYAESPREKSSSETDSDHENEDDADDENDDKNLYGTSKTGKDSRQPVNGQGNETGSRHQQRLGRRSENFLDSDRSSLEQNEKKNKDISGEDTEDPYSTLKFEREGPVSGTDESSAKNIDQLPRGQRETIMAQYHHEHQSHSQEPPPLPARHEEKQSKTCAIM